MGVVAVLVLVMLTTAVAGEDVTAGKMSPHVLQDKWSWWQLLSCLRDNHTSHCLLRHLTTTPSSSTTSIGRGDDEDEPSPVLGKPLMLLMLLRSNLSMMLMKMSLVLQVKLLLLGLAGLLLSLYRLLKDSKQHKSPSSPSHEIHYRHTQHLHGVPTTQHSDYDTSWMSDYWQNIIREHQSGLTPELHHSFYLNNPHVPYNRRYHV